MTMGADNPSPEDRPSMVLDYARAPRKLRNILLPVASILFCAIAGAVLGVLIVPRQWSATTFLVVGPNTTQGPVNAIPLSQFATAAAQSLQQPSAIASITQLANQSLPANRQTSTQVVSQSLSVKPIPNSQLIRVSAQGPDDAQLLALLTATNKYSQSLPGVRITVATSPMGTLGPSTTRLKIGGVIGTIVGLVVGALISARFLAAQRRQT